VVKVVVLENKFTSDPFHNVATRARDLEHRTEPRMTDGFCEEGEALTEPPVVEVHRKPKEEFQSNICQERHDSHLYDFLLNVGI
jgi:hypothetical protein